MKRILAFLLTLALLLAGCAQKPEEGPETDSTTKQTLPAFVPEDKRGYRRKPAAAGQNPAENANAPTENLPAEPKTAEEVPAGKTAKKSAAKKTAAKKTASKTAAKKPAAKKPAAKKSAAKKSAKEGGKG